MNKNRNKVAAMMMVAAMTFSSVAMPVEAVAKNVDRASVHREETKAVSEIKEVVLNTDNFPDPVFRESLAEQFRIANDGTGIITKEMIENCKKLYIYAPYEGSEEKKAKFLTGIEYFINLEEFSCENNNIEYADFSKNENLSKLDYKYNNTFIIKLPKNLTTLDCSGNNLTNINLSESSSLTSLNVDNNNLSELNLDDCTSLTSFSAIDNGLINLNLSNNTKLESINLLFNKNLNKLNLGEHTNLSKLILGLTNVSELDESKYPKLVNLDISRTKIKKEKLDLYNNTSLQILKIGGTDIKELDLVNNVNLQELDANGVKLEKLDISKCEKLVKLNIVGIDTNKIKSIDLSHCSYLSEFVYGNGYGYMKLNKTAPLKDIEKLFKQLIKNVEVTKGTNYIELKKLFPGIDMSKVYVSTEGVINDGEKLILGKEVPIEVEYEYDTGGKNNTLKLPVILRIKENIPPVDTNPNPEQGGSGGSGSTTPDQKPDSKPDYKPEQNPDNKPSKPIEIQGKIIGKNRYETAAKIADQMGSYNTVILVNSDKSMADGLSAASLSGKKNAPILLVKKDSIPAETKARLEKADNVYIIGGNNVISKKVENQLKGKKITRISGKDRYDTSAKIANLLGDYDTAFIVNGAKGEADAMSVSSVAAKYGAPILLTNGKTSKHLKKANVRYFVIGGKAVVSRALEDRYDADRISGVDRYSTNRKIIDEFYYDSKKVYFAKGDTLVDALAASALAKEDGIVLVSKKANHKKLEGKKAIQVGGMDFEIDVK